MAPRKSSSETPEEAYNRGFNEGRWQILDAMVKNEHIGYSRPEELYFYMRKDGTLIVMPKNL